MIQTFSDLFSGLYFFIFRPFCRSLVATMGERWKKLRHQFYKSDLGKYHVCGRSCDQTTNFSGKCPISNEYAHSRGDTCIPPRIVATKKNLIFTILWERIMDGTRKAIHLGALRSLSRVSFVGSSFEALVQIQRQYHAITKSHAPFTWPYLQRAKLAEMVQMFADIINDLYQTRTIRFSSYDFKGGVFHLAHIMSEGLSIQRVVIFDRNYMMLSALPPLRVSRSPIRTHIHKIIRQSKLWYDIRSMSDRRYNIRIAE